MKNRPPDELLEQFAPLALWREAEKQATRSPHKRFKTGCVIGQIGKLGVLATGTAHPHNGGRKTFSVHAEQHAVSRLPKSRGGAFAIIVTLTKSGNYASMNRPCESCANLLVKYVWGVIYPELTNTGEWAIRTNTMEQLLHGYLSRTKMTTDAESQ